MSNLGHWKTCTVVPPEFFGFIYRITCLGHKKWYVGKKQAQFAVTKKPLMGNKNKRHSTKESDWKYYTSSSKALNKDIDDLGRECFQFEIIMFCKSKSELAYQETLHIIHSNALFDKQSYNEYLLVRLRNKKF